MSTKAPTAAHTCCEQVRDKGRWPSYHDCRKAAKMQHEGKWYCGVHDPVKREAQRAERDKAWRAQMDRDKKRHRLETAAPQLLAALEHLVRLLEPLEQNGGMNIPGLATLNGARAAIQAAKGEA